MTIQTIADITPGGSATPLTTDDIIAEWVSIEATGTSIRFGDSNVGSSRGIPVATGTIYTTPRSDFKQGGYHLNQIYVFASSSDKVSVTYGV